MFCVFFRVCRNKQSMTGTNLHILNTVTSDTLQYSLPQMVATTEAHVCVTNMVACKSTRLSLTRKQSCFSFKTHKRIEMPWLIHKKKPLPLHSLFWQLSPLQDYHTALRCELGGQWLGKTSR
jgi:hypothetical protein